MKKEKPAGPFVPPKPKIEISNVHRHTEPHGKNPKVGAKLPQRP
jgi:hypothetical protein